jgi:hypothetical protein
LSKLQQIKEELTQLRPDIKAEAVVAQLLAAGVQWEQLVVRTDHFFYRSFSKDIFDAQNSGFAALDEVLLLHLSRTGLYDLLPEGIFFDAPETGRIPKNATAMAEEYKVNKRREQEVRTFFAPLENEFFHHRYKNFAAETALLKGLGNEQLNRYFKKFWQLPADMNAGMTLRTILLLPYAHQVAGDAGLMASFLQTIIGETVSCRLVNGSHQQTALYFNVLGQFDLGNRLTCGADYEEDDCCYVFTLHQLQRSAAQDYLEGGRFYSVLQTFYRFFTPVATHIQTDIEVLAAKENMHIGDGEEATLGIATVL